MAQRSPVVLDDVGVSPVVGMVLVLAVSVVGISAIAVWGLPAIEEMRANVEAKSVGTQFMEVLADLQELSAGTAGKTSKRWQPSLQRGQIDANTTTERWAIVWDRFVTEESSHTDPITYNFTVGHVSGADAYDNRVDITHGGKNTLLAADVSLKAYSIDGTLASAIIITQTNVATELATPATITGDWATLPAAGATKTFYLRALNSAGTASDEVPIINRGIRIDIFHQGVLASQVFIFDAGKMRFSLDAGSGWKEIILTNGGLIQGTNGKYVFLNSPPISPAKDSETAYRFFGRFINIEGEVTVSGDHRFDILVNLYGTANIIQELCNTDTDCVADIKIYPLGDLGGVWLSYYLDSNNGYKFKKYPAGSDWYLMDWKAKGMAVTYLQSVVTVTK